jgi:hypothetical protein
MMDNQWNPDTMPQKIEDPPEGVQVNYDAIFAEHVRAIFARLGRIAYQENYEKGFWPDDEIVSIDGGSVEEVTDWLYGTKVGLIHSEVSEFLECLRMTDPPMSEKIPGFLQEEEEVADAIIRLLDISGKRKLRIGSAILAKLNYNKQQRPHKHGKRF